MIEFIKKWRYAASLVLVVSTFAFVINDQGNQQEATDKLVTDFLRDEIEDDHDSCLSRADVRQVLYEILDAVVAGTISSGVALDLINVFGFEGLDPEMQTYLINLNAALNSGSDKPGAMAVIRDEFKADNPIPDCATERRTAIKQFERDH